MDNTKATKYAWKQYFEMRERYYELTASILHTGHLNTNQKRMVKNMYFSVPKNDRTCPCCVEVLKPERVSEDKIQIGNCGHILHTICMEKWYIRNPERICALCRQPVDPIISLN